MITNDILAMISPEKERVLLQKVSWTAMWTPLICSHWIRYVLSYRMEQVAALYAWPVAGKPCQQQKQVPRGSK